MRGRAAIWVAAEHLADAGEPLTAQLRACIRHCFAVDLRQLRVEACPAVNSEPMRDRAGHPGARCGQSGQSGGEGVGIRLCPCVEKYVQEEVQAAVWQCDRLSDEIGDSSGPGCTEPGEEFPHALDFAALMRRHDYTQPFVENIGYPGGAVLTPQSSHSGISIAVPFHDPRIDDRRGVGGGVGHGWATAILAGIRLLRRDDDTAPGREQRGPSSQDGFGQVVLGAFVEFGHDLQRRPAHFRRHSAGRVAFEFPPDGEP
jgi:hypothetical protein